MDKDLHSIQEARRLVETAHAAWLQYERFSEAQVDAILAAISAAGITHAARLAEMAVDETGFGRVEDKTLKNLFCARNVYEAIRPLKTVGIVRDDKEAQIIEVASPVGVIVGIIPSTNPTSTTIYKSLIALKARNAIVFSPHPSATRSIIETVRTIREAAEAAGAPSAVISSMETPTIEGTAELMKNPRTALILATGGPGLVRAAYSSGKPAFGVGPGNVPAYIESTADVPHAVTHVLAGKCFDNGTLCSSEQSLISDDAIREEVLAELRAQGAYVCDDAERHRLEEVIRGPGGSLNTKIVGQSASRIAKMAHIDVPSETRALVGFAEGVGPDHPLSIEKLSPVLAFYSVKDWREGCEKCIDILRYGGLGHTLALHTADDEVVRAFALEKPAYRICVNTPAALGAVGYTTNLFPSMTLGCGAAGGNITSDNISPLHLINLKRVAFGVREVASEPAPKEPQMTRTSNADIDKDRIAALIDSWLARKSTEGEETHRSSDATGVADGVPSPATAPPLDSFDQLEPQPQSELATLASEPVAFVSEEDVRSAARSNRKITIGARTIVTPSARELGHDLELFVEAGDDLG